MLDDAPRSWATSTAAELLAALPLPRRGRRAVLAVDGHGGSGKSTLADRLVAAAEVPAAVVHTDDVAWHHSIFGWAEAMADGILAPYRDGRPVRFRPPGWVAKDRPGAIEVPSETELLILEGTGSGRHELGAWTDALIWVHIDLAVARERALTRDVATGVNGGTWESAARFWDEWMAEEIPFLTADRPWERADAVVHGSPDVPTGPGEITVAVRPSR